MKLKLLVLVMSAATIAALAVPPAAAQGKGGPVLVGEDEGGDWGCNQDCSLAGLGERLGQDLVGASLEVADATTVNFIITLTALPPTGGMPEISRYNWDFLVDGEAFQLTGGFTEFIRGICNPLVPNSCPPPRNPGTGPFFLRQGPCTAAVPPQCEEVALLHATFDAGAGTITIPVPLEVIGAKPGSKITPGVTAFGGSVYSAPQASVSLANLPHDTMVVTKTFTIPRGKKKK